MKFLEKEEEIGSNKEGKKNKKIVRMAGGQIWEDPSLLEWDEGNYLFMFIFFINFILL